MKGAEPLVFTPSSGFLLILSLLLLAAVGIPWVYPAGAGGHPDCEPDRGPCIKKTDRGEITLDIVPKPVKAMEELTFTIRVTQDPPFAKDAHGGFDKIILNLGMPGMYMGKNEIVLRNDGSGNYTGKGMLPRCPSGGRLWKATADLPGRVSVDFTFNVSH